MMHRDVYAERRPQEQFPFQVARSPFHVVLDGLASVCGDRRLQHCANQIAPAIM